MNDLHLQIIMSIGMSGWIVYTCVSFIGYYRYESDLVGALFNSSLVIMGLVLGFIIRSFKRKTKEAVRQ